MEPIKAGTVAPDFEAKDSRGEMLRLSSFRGKKVILYFFPKAFTGGCTTETKGFADMSPGLSKAGVQIIGVSVDTAETQSRFASHCRADFPIVADDTKAIARSFGVLSFLGFSKRVSFVMDEKGVVIDVVASMLPGPHLRRTKDLFLSASQNGN